jgi:hypothetical protein
VLAEQGVDRGEGPITSPFTRDSTAQKVADDIVADTGHLFGPVVFDDIDFRFRAYEARTQRS